MAKFKPCNYAQMVMLPIALENQLVPGSLEQTINEVVEKQIRLISSRQMERACIENITFMALACGYTPDHSAIAAFISSMQEEKVDVQWRLFALVHNLGKICVFGALQ